MREREEERERERRACRCFDWSMLPAKTTQPITVTAHVIAGYHDSQKRGRDTLSKFPQVRFPRFPLSLSLRFSLPFSRPFLQVSSRFFELHRLRSPTMDFRSLHRPPAECDCARAQASNFVVQIVIASTVRRGLRSRRFY